MARVFHPSVDRFVLNPDREAAQANEEEQSGFLLRKPNRGLVHVHLFPCTSLLDPHPSSSVVHPYGFVIRRSNRPYQVSCNDSGVPIDLYFHITRLESDVDSIENCLSRLGFFFRSGGPDKQPTPTAKIGIVWHVVLAHTLRIMRSERSEKVQKRRLHVTFIIGQDGWA